MLLDPTHGDSTPPFSQTPDPSPEPQTTIPITPRMWEAILNCMTAQEMIIEELKHDLQALRHRHSTLEHDHYTLATLTPRTHVLELKIPDPPMFNGDRKELLPFLTKCQLKFEGQPSRFPNERSKVLYAGTQLEGPAFNWFQPYIKMWPVDTPSDLAPNDIRDWETFQQSLTRYMGTPTSKPWQSGSFVASNKPPR